MARTLWRPRLFGALGAGFANDPTVKDGVHLRFSLDPRLGLPRAPEHKGFELAFLRTKEGSINRVDLFQTTSPYPVHSTTTNLGAGPGFLLRDAGSLRFARPLDPNDWLAVWRYMNRRQLVGIFDPSPGEADAALLDYLDGVLGGLAPASDEGGFAEVEDAVAVDLRFRAPVIVGAGPVAPGGIGGARPEAGTVRRPGGFAAPDLGTRPGRFERLEGLERFGRFGSELYLTVRAYDHCDRLVDEDWVGRHRLIVRVPTEGVLAARAAAWKLTARLRAPGIRRVEIVPAGGRPPLDEDEIRWVFCDEFAAHPRLWASLGHAVLQADPAAWDGAMLRDAVYGPFRAAADPVDWDDRAERLRDRFLLSPEVQGLVQAPGTFEAFRFAATISDAAGATGTGDDSVELPLLAALHASAVDPVVARLLGLYGHAKPSPDWADRDWRVIARPPFAEDGNLARLDTRLRGIFDPGAAFFHEPGDALTAFRLAGLALDLSVGQKPAPPTPDAALDVRPQLVPARTDGFNHLVESRIRVAPEQVETRPWRVNASYEVFRELTGEPPQNVVEDAGGGPLDDVGIVPDVMVPDFDRATCLSTGRVVDVFSRDAVTPRQLAYRVRGFDIFGRPSAAASTAPFDLEPACLPPPPPGPVSSLVYEDGGLLKMDVLFGLGEIATPAQASWEALEVLVYRVPVEAGVPPEATAWTGARPGRRLEVGFDPVTLALQVGTIQASCQRLEWSGGTLDRQPDGEAVCSAAFPGTATIAPEPFNGPVPLGTSLQTYRLTLGLGTKAQLPQGLNGWCARLRVRGSCPSGAPRLSPEVANRATLMVTPPPPVVVQPPAEDLPPSTYPDVLGNGYFGIDLRSALGAPDQAGEALVKVFLARLERLTDTPEAFVAGDQVIDPPGLIALARASQSAFALVTDPPHAFDAAKPRYDLRVPGDLEAVYVAAVLGSNAYLEEAGWQGAAFFPFRTPAARPRPTLEWVEAAAVAAGGSLRTRHVLVARFGGPLPDPDFPPRLQLFRRDLSAGDGHAVYLDTVTGITDDPTAADPEYRFAYTDDGLRDWRRYVFEAQLLDYAPGRGQHVKVLGRQQRRVLAPWGGAAEPFESPAPIAVGANPAGGFFVDIAFAAGEFDFALSKARDGDTRRTLRGRIEDGRLLVPAGTVAALQVGPGYALRLEDPDPSPGLYTFRLSFGQRLVRSTDARTP